MYTVTSRPLVSRTLATFRSAEFGFLGVVVYTRRQTPRFWGHESSAGELLLLATTVRPFRDQLVDRGHSRSFRSAELYLNRMNCYL